MEVILVGQHPPEPHPLEALYLVALEASSCQEALYPVALEASSCQEASYPVALEASSCQVLGVKPYMLLDLEYRSPPYTGPPEALP